MRKYGIEHFHIEQLEETNSPEEREQFWIEQTNSYKHGYNATLGGDGKKYIDYDLVVETYYELGSVKDTSKQLHISERYVSTILKISDVNVQASSEILRQKYSKAVGMYSLDDEYIKSFESLQAAAKYLVANELTGCKVSTIRTHISEVCCNKRKTAANFKWKFE